MDAYLTGLAFPSVARGGGFAGDSEGTDVPTVIAGQSGSGRGDSYTPLPGVLPTKDHLEYARSFSVAALLALGLLMLLAVGILNPKRAVHLVARGAQRQAGIA